MDEDRLRIDDFVPAAGGEWYGLLFANPTLGLPPQLTWSFTFPFQEVPRYDDTVLSLTVEWLPMPAAADWRSVAGQHLTCAGFAEPAEASVYHSIHHRFEKVDLHLVEQRDRSLRAAATVSGDIDRLGVDPVHADAWLTFTGILVQLPDVTDPDEALTRLADVTDTSHLTFDPTGSTAALRFTPRQD
ncbi:hypothetical protein OHA72_40055 [Dactylosporangium sp. NBC_01737]|uniref:hypothetical protein n=1 Tax=Dactylosporangium sp. NBC_01737 TaxID=2975959 RepID=UPI002E14728B|nr:hypothetical protein OHA72_40055 [Dactylosporangium sp. NBC_01737]